MSEFLGSWGDMAQAAILVTVDFSWQSTLLIAAVLGMMKLFRVRGVSVRYFLLVCALFAVGVLPFVNVVWTRADVTRFSVRRISGEGGAAVQTIGRGVPRQEGGPARETPPGTAEEGSSSGEAASSYESTSSMQRDWQGGVGTLARGAKVHRYALLFGVWGVGILVGFSRVLWGYRKLRRLRASCRPEGDASVLAAYEEALRSARLRRKPRLLASPHIPMPMTVGVLDPAVLVPDRLGERLSFEKLKMVLLHELVHVEQRDLLVALYQRLLNVVWFFHPFIRYLNNRTAEVCEDRCDGLVLERTGEPAAYAKAVMEILGKAGAYPRLPAFVAAGLQRRPRLALRIRSILDGIPVGSLPRWGVPAGVISACFLAGLLSFVTILSGLEIPRSYESVAISGIVQNQRGDPVEGAKVYAFRGGSWASFGRVRTAVDGRFDIAGLLPGPFGMNAEAEGYAPSLLLGVAGGTKDVKFVLGEGGAIAGKVFSEGGHPESGIMVTAGHYTNLLHSVWARTDANGVYRIPHLGEGTYRVQVPVTCSPSVYGRLVTDGRLGDRMVRVQDGETTEGVDFLLVPGPSVSGRVTYHRTGEPAARIPVTLRGPCVMDTVTSAEGRYVFQGVPPGRYWVTVDLEEYAGVSQGPSFDVVMEEDARDIDVTLTRKGALSVVVQDETGHPVPGAEVRCESRQPGLWTDEEGRCRFGSLSREWDRTVWADHPEYALSFVRVGPMEEGEDREITVRLSRGGTLRGSVTDWEGEPVWGARVRFFAGNEPIIWGPEGARTVFTNREGAYRVERLPPVRSRVVVDHSEPRFIPKTSIVEVREGDVTTWDVSVDRGGTVMGHVVDRQGAPVKGVQMQVWPLKFHPWEIRTDERGVYRADHLSPGEYRVSVWMHHYGWEPSGAEQRSVRILEGEIANADLIVDWDK